MRNLTFLVVLLMGLQFTGLGQYTMTVESYPAVQSGLTTYRFYVNMTDPTDRMSAVYGYNTEPLSIDAPSGVHNNAFNSSWNASRWRHQGRTTQLTAVHRSTDYSEPRLCIPRKQLVNKE